MLKKIGINTNLVINVAAQVARFCWVLMIVALVVTAIFISLSRHFIPLLAPNFKVDIEHQLSSALQAPVKVGSVSGAMVKLNPEITLKNIYIGNKTLVKNISIDVAVVQSLMARQLRFADVKATGIQATLTQLENGWQLGDVFFPNQAHQDFSWVSMLSGIHVNESDVHIILKNSKKFSINKIDLILNQYGKRQRIISNITLPNKKTAMFIVEGKGLWANFNNMEWDIYAKLPDMDWLPWLKENTDKYITVQKIEGSGQAWLRWRDSKIDDVRVRLELPSFAWQYVSNHVSESVKAVHVELIYQQHKDKTILSIPFLSFMKDGQSFQLGGWSATTAPADESRTLVLLESNKLQLDSFVKLALASQLLPDKSQEVLQGLSPNGEFHQLKGAAFFNNQHKLIDFKIAGQLQNVSLKAWDGSPTVSGVNGDVIFNKSGGHFALNSTHFSMEFPDLFAQGWQYRLAKGDLYWVYDDEKFIIRSGVLNVSNDVANVFGRFDFTSPHDLDEPDHLGLILSFKDVDAAHRMQYIPTKEMDKSLSEWLARAIVKGTVTQGVYLYDGGVTQALVGDETQQVALDLKNVDLKFDEAWPVLENINGTFIYNNDDMRVYANAARLLNADVKNINVRLPTNENKLEVNAHVNTSMQTVMELFRTTPIHAEIGSDLDNWQTDGLVSADLALGIPLANQSTQVDVRGFVKNTSLKIPDINLDFTDVNGDINYSSVLGLSSQKLTATAFNMPVQMSITTAVKDPSLTARVRTQGSIAVDTLAAWQPSSLWSYIKGTLPYNLELQIPLRHSAAGKKPLSLVVNSSLQGTTIALPKPFGKKLNDTRQLKTTTTFNTDHYRIDASLNHEDVRGLFVIGKNKEPLKANVYLGSIATVIDPVASGVSISGNTSSVLVDEWLTFFDKQKKSSVRVDTGVMDVTVDIGVGTLQAFDQQVKDAQLRVNRQNQAWRVGVESQVISGMVTLPENSQSPYDVALAHIKLPKTDAMQAVTATVANTATTAQVATSTARSDPLASVKPADLPNMQVKIDNFMIGEELYGKWYFTLNKIKNGVEIKNIQIDNMKYFSITGKQVTWTQDKTQSQTHFKGRATTTDLETALKAWGNETGISSEQASFELDMIWPGSPIMFSTVDGNGNIKFKFEDGRINDVSGKTNALKVFGIMNLSALTRRLTGEFSDLYKSGISYDKVEGNVNLQEGIATFVKPMTINGPSSDFKLTGTANFKTGEIDQEVLVMPPVGQNATLIATVLCGPACGAIAYATQWIAGSSIKKFVSLKYKMTGSFNNPKVDKETIVAEVTPTPSASAQ